MEDLNFPIRIIIAPIIRDEAGLAMSSRNKHLSADERKRALVLSQSLRRAGDLLKKGERRWEVIRKEMESIVRSGSPTVIDYISLVRYDNLQSVEYVSGRSVIAVAAFFGTTRLIDNMIVRIEGDNIECTH